MFALKAIPDEIIDARINSFKAVYLFLAIVGVAGVPMFALERQIADVLWFLLNAVICLAVYYGLKEKRKWVFPLIIIFSAYSLLSHLQNLLDHSSSNDDVLWSVSKIVTDIVDSAWILFSAYQIYFFPKKEVREYFGIKGVIIFS